MIKRTKETEKEGKKEKEREEERERDEGRQRETEREKETEKERETEREKESLATMPRVIPGDEHVFTCRPVVLTIQSLQNTNDLKEREDGGDTSKKYQHTKKTETCHTTLEAQHSTAQHRTRQQREKEIRQRPHVCPPSSTRAVRTRARL